MRRLLIGSIVPLIVLLAACGQWFSSAPSGNTSQSAQFAAATASASNQPASALPNAACTNLYYPVSSGASWSYSSSGSVIGNYTYVHSITALSATGFTSSDQFNSGIRHTIQWNCQDGNLTALDTGLSAGSIANSKMKMTPDSVSADGYNIPAVFDTGKTWTEKVEISGSLALNGGIVGSSQNVAILNCRAAGNEAVVVPAGSFDTVKVTCTANFVNNTALEGVQGQPVSDTDSSIDWYARGVGLVKSLSTGADGTETIVLTHYTLK